MCDGVLDQVAVGGEILQLIDSIVEAHDGGFATGPHHGLREENTSLAHFGEKGRDPGTRLDQDHRRDGVAAQIEMGDLLCHPVIGNLKILGLQVVDHLAASIADGHRGVHQGDLHLDLWLSVPGRLLHGNAGLRRERS